MELAGRQIDVKRFDGSCVMKGMNKLQGSVCSWMKDWFLNGDGNTKGNIAPYLFFCWCFCVWLYTFAFRVFFTEGSKLTLQRAVSSHHTNHWSQYMSTICKQLREWKFVHRQMHKENCTRWKLMRVKVCVIDGDFVLISGGPEILHTPCVEETCSVGTVSGKLIWWYHDYKGCKVW